MINRNVIFPSLIIVLSAIILAVISQFEQPRFQDASVNAQFFPTVIAIMQIIICIALLVQYKLKKIESDGQPILSKMALFGLIFLCCYAVLISIIGYLYASLIAFTIYLVFFKIKKPLYYVVAWVFVFSIYYLFGEVFYIALPDGLFY
ncbi:tripartite tricarboxylate transporter TctB family protein [Vibrio natriegens]|uniref:tripartite tricarboxylate transporter TctB family protein n=1 Tax=Vibrio natriegens TaxID=691 RepID=UPI0021E93659|nr:tripartite tricarboxylate transporter TctB family protein [Vibrio natriegens]UYI50078.1 tripartite tricarboxylate transporter TctB family protein [Vibrio natriegens]